MKLSQLNEGLIKLPEKMLGEMVHFTAKVWFAYYLDYIEESLVGKEFHEAHELLKRELPKYGVLLEELDAVKDLIEKRPIQTKRFEVKLEELPPAYIKKLMPQVFKSDSEFFSSLPAMDVGFNVDFIANPPTIRGQYDGIRNKITLFIKGNDLHKLSLGTESGRTSCVKLKFPQMIGTLRHELTHAVQYMILQHFHEKQIEYNDYGKIPAEKLEAYVLSDVEFDPAIKTGVGIFKSIEAKMKETDPNWDKFTAFRFFTCSDGTSEPSKGDLEKIGFTKRANFFKILKKRSPTKWKKAVKLFYQEISK